jgi:hypothetical protein
MSTKQELLVAYAQGEAARRAGRRIEDCPFRGNAPSTRDRADAWREGWDAQNARYRKPVNA